MAGHCIYPETVEDDYTEHSNPSGSLGRKTWYKALDYLIQGFLRFCLRPARFFYPNPPSRFEGFLINVKIYKI
jgi:hypothetical protein